MADNLTLLAKDCILKVKVKLLNTENPNVLSSRLSATATLSGAFAAGFHAEAIATNIEVSAQLRGLFFSASSASNVVMWSKIGVASFAVDKVNDAGHMPMHWNGSVLNILQLGKNAVVYGDKGIAMLVPVANPDPTFGLKPMYELGIVGKLAVTGDLEQHVFLNVNYELCSLTAEGVKVLGYRRNLSTLSNKAVLTFNVNTRRIYIRDGSKGFVFSAGQLGGGPATLASITSTGSTNVFYAPSTTSLLENFEFVSAVMDMETRVQKTIYSVGVVTDHPGPLYVIIGVKPNASATIIWSRAYLCNKENIAITCVVGVDFQIKVYTSLVTPVAARIDGLLIRYQRSDNRHRAGKGPSKYTSLLGGTGDS